MNRGLRLDILPGLYGVVKLAPQQAIPDWATLGDFFSITRTADELSLVCRQLDIPSGMTCEPGWRCLKVMGPLDFSLVGIMANLSAALAGQGISVFTISTYDTDYVLVKADNLNPAIAALKAAGHEVRDNNAH